MLVCIVLMLVFLFVWALPRLGEEVVTRLYANRGPLEATNIRPPTNAIVYQDLEWQTYLYHRVARFSIDVVLYIYNFIYIFIYIYIYIYIYIWKIKLLLRNCKQGMDFRIAYLHLILTNSRGQGQRYMHFYSEHIEMVTDIENRTIAN